jgi:hypothetical protein
MARLSIDMAAGPPQTGRGEMAERYGSSLFEGGRARVIAAVAAFVAVAALAGCSEPSDGPAGDRPAPGAPRASGARANAGGGKGTGDPAGTGDVVSAADLAAIKLPKPPGAPERGDWSQEPSRGDGDRLVTYVYGNEIWMSVRFLDCRLPMVKQYAAKPADEQGNIAYCFKKPTGMLKGYPLLTAEDAEDSFRVIQVGHLTILAGVSTSGEYKLHGADVEAYLESLDLAAIAKL